MKGVVSLVVPFDAVEETFRLSLHDSFLSVSLPMSLGGIRCTYLGGDIYPLIRGFARFSRSTLRLSPSLLPIASSFAHLPERLRFVATLAIATKQLSSLTLDFNHLAFKQTFPLSLCSTQPSHRLSALSLPLFRITLLPFLAWSSY